MFTGIIEEIGKVRSIAGGTSSFRLTVTAEKILEDIHLGDSISVNGVCLTADELLPFGFSADVMPQTLRSTSLSELKAGAYVNLERAMPANGRFGGHIVSGHIDGTGKISNIKKEENAVWMSIQVSDELEKYMIPKGSIAIDGVSLTIAAIEKGYFSISLIPHTAQKTILLQKSIGSKVNIECDSIGKYIYQFMSNGHSDRNQTGNSYSSTLDAATLKRYGY